MTMRRLVPIAFMLFLTAMATANTGNLQPGQKVSDFALTDTEGNVYRLSDLTKQGPVLIQFACMICNACPRELPYMEKIQEAYQDKGLKVLAIFREGRAMVEPYAKRRQSSVPFLLDSDRAVAKRLGVDVDPTVVLIGKNGKVASVCLGYSWRNVNPLSEKVATLLKVSNEVIIKTPPTRVG
jgi:peroxiredoxin